MIEDPQAGCVDIAFTAGCTLTPASQVALEDYARVLTSARHCQALLAPDCAAVEGVHVCAPEADCSSALRGDIEAFAADLANASEGRKLGWS